MSPVATPTDGFEAKVLTEAQFLAGEDARGTLVILEPETDLRHEHLAALLARSVRGFISGSFAGSSQSRRRWRRTISCSPSRHFLRR